jgi:tRNA/tmRNA/rRNA uracil-C5-methylase (TrmA/RlmC/RlmD family)
MKTPFNLDRTRTAPFAERLLREAFPDKTFQTLPIEAFADLAYSDELALKNATLQAFWKSNRIDGTPEAILPSPLPRHYRTSTKRRVLVSRKGVTLSFIGGNAAQKSDAKHHESVLEPESHQKIYAFLSEKLNVPAYSTLARHLNFVIVRGSYREPSVIFNVDMMNGEIVRKLKLLSEQLKVLPESVVSAYIFQDATRSAYTFEQKRPEVQVPFKRLYGAERLFLKILDKKFSYHPTAFSQVNESLLPAMLQTAEAMLAPHGSRLLDLYCGYGLFGLFLSEHYSEVIGLDAEGVSIQSARENAPYFKASNKASKVMFLSKRITADALKRSLPPPSENEVVILDPPRQGTEQGTIQQIALRKPVRVLHIFCGVDEIPKELKAWNQCGYRAERVLPLDMFAGTPNLETMVLLEPKS